MGSLLQLYPLPRVGIMLILGIVFGSVLSTNVPAFVWLIVVLVCIGALLVLRKKPYTSSGVILLGVFFLGSWLIGIHLHQLKTFDDDVEKEYQGVIISKPVQRGKVVRFDMLVVGTGKPIKVRVSLMRDTHSEEYHFLQIGNGLTILSRINPFTQYDTSSSFDYVRWAQVQGYGGQTFVSDGKWCQSPVSLSSLSWLQKARISSMKWRDFVVNTLSVDADVDDKSSMAIVAAMTLGDKSGLDETTKQLFSITGTSHILALSGMHLGILYAVLLVVFPRKKKRIVSQMIIILTIWTYVLLTGMSTSLIRSATMFTIMGLMSLSNRMSISLNTLSLAAILMLVVHPLSLWDVGFQLSFVSVFTILLMFRWLENKGFVPRTWKGKAFATFVVLPVAAQIGTFPLVLYYFGRFSCYFLLSNLVVVPSAILILYGVLFALIVWPFEFLRSMVFQLVIQVVEWLQTSLSFIASLPGSSISGIRLSVLQVILVYVLIISVFGIVHYLLKAYDKARKIKMLQLNEVNPIFVK